MFGAGTIYSNFTPLVKSPVIGYRISGDEVLEILTKLTNKNFSKDHSRVRIVKLYKKDGSLLDECSVVYFKSPKSFTGEDVCEVFLHGSPLIASQFEQTLKDFKVPGLRLAKNGEFSYRSVLNSKNSLKQAKAINQIISNDSFSSLEYNKKLLFEGDQASGLIILRDEIVDLFSEITASIDFVDDEEFSFKKIMKKVRLFFEKCHNILQKAENSQKEKTVCKIMIVGSVNVGKSTLFNKIIDTERAIVTNIKGTTRDVLSNEFVFDGKKYELFDTAGHRDKQGKIEKFGYKKAQQISSDIDHFLILSDKYTTKKQMNLMKKDFNIKKNFTLIETKSDQYQYNSKNIKINHSLGRDTIMFKLKISLIHKKYVSSKIKKIDFNDEEIVFLDNISQYKNDLLNESDILIIAQIMRNILDDFSYEFGYINNEDIYDRVFSNFCIGK
ncbi:50S ribosome-binding GTPase [Alphaproteobacteria bacterium]|nr:50S ribosome-binding GTPase [Alphaproteobacteria bacterium]